MRVRVPRFARTWLLFALLLSIPAFYLALTALNTSNRNWGRALYFVVAVIIFWDLSVQTKKGGRHFAGWRTWPSYLLEILIGFGALLSSWRIDYLWTETEWLLRLALVAAIFVRLSLLLAKFVAPNRLTQILSLAVLMLVISGGGFYWLEPRVHS